MTLDEMRAAVRHDLQDNTKPYRWGDDFLTRAINEAETEACRRARLITDSTSALTRVSFRIGDPACKLDPRIMFVRRLKIVGETDRKSTRLNSSHHSISYAVFCLKKKKK